MIAGQITIVMMRNYQRRRVETTLRALRRKDH
jgi:hypothetical protein